MNSTWREYWSNVKKRVRNVGKDNKISCVNCLHCQTYHDEATIVYNDVGRFFYCRLCNLKSRLPNEQNKL